MTFAELLAAAKANGTVRWEKSRVVENLRVKDEVIQARRILRSGWHEIAVAESYACVPLNAQQKSKAKRRKRQNIRRNRKRPIALLVRKTYSDGSVWVRYGSYATEEHAAEAHKKSIEGKGVTAWSWWGPVTEARKMLKDPTYMPPEQTEANV